jgi:hypothetical protein
MSINTFGADTFTATPKPAGPLARGAAKTISILFAVARKIGHEIAVTLAADIANGKIKREREDWER